MDTRPFKPEVLGSSPAPFTFRLRVREAYGATLLMWCAATHRRFKSFRKRFRAGMKCPALSVYILRHHVCAESFEDSLAQGVLCVWHIFHGTYLIRIYPHGIFIACTCRDGYERHCTAFLKLADGRFGNTKSHMAFVEVTISCDVWYNNFEKI